MAADPVDRIAEILGRVAARAEEYVAVATTAATRNANGDYDANALLEDVQRVAEHAVRDGIELTSYVLEAFFGAVPEAEASE